MVELVNFYIGKISAKAKGSPFWKIAPREITCYTVLLLYQNVCSILHSLFALS